MKGALLVALSLAACHKEDPRPAAHLEYRVDAVDPAQADGVARVVRRRLNAEGQKQAKVVLKADGRLIVDFHGDDAEKARIDSILRRRGKLEFVPVDDEGRWLDATQPPAGVSIEHESWSAEEGGQHTGTFLRADDRKALLAFVAASPPADDDHYLAVERRQIYRDASSPKIDFAAHRLRRHDALASPQIDAAEAQLEPTNNHWQVSLTFGPEDGRRFGALTEVLVGHKLAIVLDGDIQSAPVVQTRIPGGKCVITMGGSDLAVQKRDAEDLAFILRSGELPADLQPI